MASHFFQSLLFSIFISMKPSRWQMYTFRIVTINNRKILTCVLALRQHIRSSLALFVRVSPHLLSIRIYFFHFFHRFFFENNDVQRRYHIKNSYPLSIYHVGRFCTYLVSLLRHIETFPPLCSYFCAVLNVVLSHLHRDFDSGLLHSIFFSLKSVWSL